MTQRGPTGIYWGELPCRFPFELERSTGFDPAVARVRSLRSDVSDWVLRHDPAKLKLEDAGLSGFQAVLPPRVSDVLTADTPPRLKALLKLPSRAPLTVVEVRGEKARDTAGVPLMWLVDVSPVDEWDPPMIELVLADVRYFWRDYGELTLDVNVPAPDGPAADGTPRYSPRSLRPATTEDEKPRPWKASEVLQLVLNRLPGTPQVRLFPGFRDGVARELRAVGASPLEVLQALTADLDLVFALNLDGTASFFPRGVGAIGEVTGGIGSDNDKAHDPRTGKGVWEGEVLSNLFGTRPAIDSAEEVAVIGPPPIYTVKVDFLDPVLPLDLPETATAPAERAEFPLTPDLLDTVAPFTTRLVIDLPGLDGKRSQSVLDTSQAARRMALLRAPFFGDEWPSTIEGVPRPLQEQLTDRLWRFYRLPKRLERLLPILDRAERGVHGGRLRPVVEAFGFEAFEVVVERDEAPPPGVAKDTRTLAEVELQAVEGEIGTLRSAIDGLGPLVVANFTKAWDEWTKRQDAPEGQQAAEEKPNFQKLADAARRGVLNTLTDALGVQEAAKLDPNAVTLAELQGRLTELLRRRGQLLETASPIKAAQEAVLAAHRAFQERQRATGVVPAAEQAALLAAQKKLTALQAAAPPATKRQVTVLEHVNTGRRQVRATIHEDGLIELDEPAVWLANPRVADPAATYAVPMPVAITFGTWNRSDPTPYPEQGYRFSQEQREYTPVANRFMEAAARLLSGIESGPAELAIYRPGLGNVLQTARPGMDGALRLTFNRQDRTTGRAEVGEAPFRIVRGGEFQVYFPLDQVSGSGNLEEVRQRAALLASQAFVATSRLSGSLTVMGAKPVNVNGNICTVRWVGDERGHVDTVLLFDGQTSTGIEALKDPPPFPGPFVFGIDLSTAPVAR